jgi:hypothetical protein
MTDTAARLFMPVTGTDHLFTQRYKFLTSVEVINNNWLPLSSNTLAGNIFPSTDFTFTTAVVNNIFEPSHALIFMAVCVGTFFTSPYDAVSLSLLPELGTSCNYS